MIKNPITFFLAQDQESDLPQENKLPLLINNKLEELTAEDIAVGDDIVDIRNYAFRDMSLIKVTLPIQTRNIGQYAFYNNQKLEQINFPQGLEIISVYSFQDCTNLKVDVDLKNTNVRTIGYYAFRNCGIKSLILPKNISVDVNFCSNCKELERVYFSYPTTFKSGATIETCTALKRVEFEEGFTEITNANKTFQWSSAIKFIIPSSATNLYGLLVETGVQNLIVKAETPPTVSSAITGFNYIFVPTASISQYKSATNWSASNKYYPLVNTYEDLSSATNYEYACVIGNDLGIEDENNYKIYQYIDGQWYEV